MTRRRTLLGAGALAAAAGLGVAAWRERHEPPVTESLWSLHFRRPGGGDLVLAEFRGKPLLLNFWATWCPPCVTEMPLLARFRAEHRGTGWQVLGLAIDREDPVLDFLVERAIDFPIAMAGAAGLELAKSLGNTAGGLPFSIALAGNGSVIARKLGLLNAQTLEEWAVN